MSNFFVISLFIVALFCIVFFVIYLIWKIKNKDVDHSTIMFLSLVALLCESCLFLIFFSTTENIERSINYETAFTENEIISEVKLSGFAAQSESRGELEGSSTGIYFLQSGKIEGKYGEEIVYTYRQKTEKGEQIKKLIDEGNVFIKDVEHNETPRLVQYKSNKKYIPVSVNEDYSIYYTLHKNVIDETMKTDYIDETEQEKWYTFYLPGDTLLQTYEDKSLE